MSGSSSHCKIHTDTHIQNKVKGYKNDSRSWIWGPALELHAPHKEIKDELTFSYLTQHLYATTQVNRLLGVIMICSLYLDSKIEDVILGFEEPRPAPKYS